MLDYLFIYNYLLSTSHQLLEIFFMDDEEKAIIVLKNFYFRTILIVWIYYLDSDKNAPILDFLRKVAKAMKAKNPERPTEE